MVDYQININGDPLNYMLYTEKDLNALRRAVIYSYGEMFNIDYVDVSRFVNSGLYAKSIGTLYLGGFPRKPARWVGADGVKSKVNPTTGRLM